MANTTAKVEARAAYLNSLAWPSAPWTDQDHAQFKAASDRFDALWLEEYGD